MSKKHKKQKRANHFYLGTSVGTVHVNMDPNADKETFDAVQRLAELAHKKVK